MDSVFQLLDSGFYLCRFQIPKLKKIPDFSLWFAPNFCISFSRNDFNGRFIIEGYVV